MINRDELLEILNVEMQIAVYAGLMEKANGIRTAIEIIKEARELDADYN